MRDVKVLSEKLLTFPFLARIYVQEWFSNFLSKNSREKTLSRNSTVDAFFIKQNYISGILSCL